MRDETWDVVVVGGGHAGCEAAAAAARCGARTLLLTHRWTRSGRCPATPPSAGSARAHLVREIDALDGIMGRAADAAGIHFKLLNRSKGPAGRGAARAGGPEALPRRGAVLAARDPEPDGARRRRRGAVPGAGDAVAGVETASGRRIAAGAVVITTGTFLRGEIHIGS
jgi:tRNA uridine 5-carboxymethylaminomethyl modification enzyme